MSKWLHFCRKGLTFGVACGLAMLALAGQVARAGNVTIYISEAGVNGGVPFSFDWTSPLSNGTGDMNHVQADANGATPPALPTGALNAFLQSSGYDFVFQSLSANSNLPGTGPLGAQLFMTGQVERFTTTGGDKTITIDVTQNDYFTGPPPLFLRSAVTGNFTNAPGGNNQLGTSYFNSNNAQDDTSGPHTTTLNFTSTGPAPNGHGGSSGPVTLNSPPLFPPFSLTGRLVITLGQLSDVNNPPTDQFSISTSAVVPEPASIALMGMGLPVVIVGLGWLRRRRAAA